MRRREITAAVVALALLSGLPSPAAARRDQALRVTAPPQSCIALPVNFGTRFFDYQAGWSSNSYVPDNCTLEISPLYMDGTCSTLRNNNGNGCGGGPGTVVTADAASCQAVAADGSRWQPVFYNAPSVTRFDFGRLCADATTGSFYIQNTCPDSFTFDVVLQTWSYSSCTGGTFPSWARVTIGIACGLVAMLLMFTAVKRCTRRAPAAPVVVQMAPQGSQGYYSGSAAGYGTYPNAGPAGYPPQPPPGQQGYGYSGAWGSAPPPGGYPAGYGPPPPAGRPQHVPPPMTTVVLGGPEGSQGEVGGPPRPSPAAGDSASKV